MSEAVASTLGPKLLAASLAFLAVFAVVGYSSVQVSATSYLVSVEVHNRSPFAASINSVQLDAWNATTGTLIFSAVGTNLPVDVPSGGTATVSLSVYMTPGLSALPNSTMIHVVGSLSYSVGFLHPSVSLSGDYTVGQIRAVMGAASAYA